MLPGFEIAKDKVTITYHSDSDYERVFRDDIELTIAGPVGSTTELAPRTQ